MYKDCTTCMWGGCCEGECLEYKPVERDCEDRDAGDEVDLSDEELAAIADDETRIENEGGFEND